MNVFSAAPVMVAVWQIVLCIFSCTSDSHCVTDCTVYFQLSQWQWLFDRCILSCTSDGRCLTHCSVYFQVYQWLFDESYHVFSSAPVTVTVWWIILCIFSCDGLYCVFSAVAVCIVYFQLWWIVLCIFSCDGLYCVFSAVMDCTVYFQLWLIGLCIFSCTSDKGKNNSSSPGGGASSRWWCVCGPKSEWHSGGWQYHPDVSSLTWCPQECGSVLAVRLPDAHTRSVAE